MPCSFVSDQGTMAEAKLSCCAFLWWVGIRNLEGGGVEFGGARFGKFLITDSSLTESQASRQKPPYLCLFAGLSESQADRHRLGDSLYPNHVHCSAWYQVPWQVSGRYPAGTPLLTSPGERPSRGFHDCGCQVGTCDLEVGLKVSGGCALFQQRSVIVDRS
ncbi:hypothetical protein VTI74DRAFT_4553 [Chaetomium olivicolor]